MRFSSVNQVSGFGYDERQRPPHGADGYFLFGTDDEDYADVDIPPGYVNSLQEATGLVCWNTGCGRMHSHNSMTALSPTCGTFRPGARV